MILKYRPAMRYNWELQEIQYYEAAVSQRMVSPTEPHHRRCTGPVPAMQAPCLMAATRPESN